VFVRHGRHEKLLGWKWIFIHKTRLIPLGPLLRLYLTPTVRKGLISSINPLFFSSQNRSDSVSEHWPIQHSRWHLTQALHMTQPGGGIMAATLKPGAGSMCLASLVTSRSPSPLNWEGRWYRVVWEIKWDHTLKQSPLIWQSECSYVIVIITLMWQII